MGRAPGHRACGCVGVVAWSLPNAAVIDVLGLNDHEIARTPVTGRERAMAHDRRPPAVYVECFRPNVKLKNGKPRASARRDPLTDEQIRACESTARRLPPKPS